ncbi:MAG TPA: response regulator transcription factor [Stellaceae bacterium]|jgi:DNA-binding response OmpR family regulator/DNA-binding CsgD family transcriptional regulator|nr:response regulator transcription factor [Stellaceae bacterium]
MPEGTPRPIALVIDDSPETLRFLTDALEEAGFTALVALAGESALALAQEATPDIVLLDAVMPGMDGFETCRRLKASKGLAYVPVIFMTGLSETEHVIKGLEAGGVDYVAKPIVPDELIARMQVHLANARLGQSARNALDAAGRFLLAIDHAGRVLWCTPQAGKLLETAFPPATAEGFRLPEALVRRLIGPAEPHGVGEAASLAEAGGEPRFQLSYIGKIGADEFLLRLAESEAASEESRLKQHFALTAREADVLVWVARGKSNRDIGEILGLSPRTVNKHLEQIYEKLGVENRTSAAALALRALGTR